MVLIGAVRAWDDSKISCVANSHLAANNPLRVNGLLSVYTGVEYAAQAMAAHARLTAPAAQETTAPRKGFLAVASKLSASVQNLDTINAELQIDLEMIAANADSSMYSFVLSADQSVLLTGQLMAVMQPGAEMLAP